MPRGIPNKPSKKKTAKKVTKKTTKRTRKSAEVDIKVDAATQTEPSPEVGGESDTRAFDEALHQAFEDAINNGVGQFSASGMLDLNAHDRVSSARGNVVFSVRKLVEASIAIENSANSTLSERDVATARHRLAVAEFELAMDGLESAIRG